METDMRRPCVLVFSGHDPSGGAGIQADIEAIAAQGAHALPVITALTVQDNNRVYAVHPVAPTVITAQVRAVIASIPVKAIKLGIAGSKDNAALIASLVRALQQEADDQGTSLPIVLDPVLGSGRGHSLSMDDARTAIAPLLEVATLITPNLPELAKLAVHGLTSSQQAVSLLGGRCQDVLLKGGHADHEKVINRWFATSHPDRNMCWQWERYPGEFHGSGCTLAAAITGQLAHGHSMESSLFLAQSYTQRALQNAYPIADGQLIPNRFLA